PRAPHRPDLLPAPLQRRTPRQEARNSRRRRRDAHLRRDVRTRPINSPGSTGPQVRVGSGDVRGQPEDGLAVFRGIPFASPPVGELRLAAPMPVDPWDGVRESVVFGPPPPQSRVMGAPAARDTEGDWLTVNVWSPDLGAARLPVMVWV